VKYIFQRHCFNYRR